MDKVLLYIDSMQKGGAQRVMSVLAEHLVKAGADVTLVNDIVPVEGIPEYDLPDGIRRVFLDENVRSLRCRNLRRVIRLRKLIRSGNYQRVLSFLGPPNIRALLAAFGLQVKRIVSVRNDPDREYGTGVRGFVLKQFFRSASLTVFQTEDAALCFPKCVQRKSVVIPNPVDEAFFRREWIGDGKDIVAVGRLQRQKNYPLLIKAFSGIAAQHPQTNLKICGDGPLLSELQAMAKTCGLEERVRFLGLVSDVAEELVHAGLYVLSSDYEGMPNSLMEAMAVGVPVVSTDCPCGGPRELTEAGRYGILVPCNEAEPLGEAMNHLLSSKQELELYHENAKSRAAVYRTDIIIKKWFQVLQ